ncbi:MAG: fatty acid--CoA ligase [Gammaproteobacteria bacterium]|nr:fatty acid--CoA ligase [Gammaproteobacteria bacterium]
MSDSISDPRKVSGAYEYPLLIRQILQSALAGAPGQEIVSGGRKRYTYLEFNERVGKLAAGLESLGVGMGDTVAVMDWDNHRYLECFFAVPMMGAILHTINIRLPPEQVLYTINHAEDDVILVHADFVPMLERISDRIERTPQRILVHDQEGTPCLPDGYVAEYETLLASAQSTFVFPDFDENTPATTFYTTGTTGDPKGVAYTHRQLVLHTLGVLAGVSTASGNNRFHKGDVYMPMTPLFHVHGWGFPYVATLAGVKQVYPGRYEPAGLLALIAREAVTFSHCVPTILQMLLSEADAGKQDLSGLKLVIGGSSLSLGLAKTAMEMGIEIFAAYGLSETCPFVTTADLTDPGGAWGSGENLVRRRKPGKPVPLVDVRIVDEGMQDIPRDGKSTGEIVIRAPWLAQCYVKDPAASAMLWRGGYLHTGDVGFLDASGSLQITDRIKDVIKSGGEWVSSLELESIVSQCTGVAEVAAIGIPDETWGERPMLVVVRETGSTIDRRGVREAVRKHAESGRLPRWAIPERIEFVAGIDKTSVGKLDKKRLRARYSGSPSGKD